MLTCCLKLVKQLDYCIHFKPFSGIFSSSESADSEDPKPSGKVQSVDDFVPEVGLDRAFLEDAGRAVKSKNKPPASAPILDSDRWAVITCSLFLKAKNHLSSSGVSNSGPPHHYMWPARAYDCLKKTPMLLYIVHYESAYQYHKFLFLCGVLFIRRNWL